MRKVGLKAWARWTMVAAAAAMVVGCGDDPVPVVVLPAGAVVQGPVEGAIVFADQVNAGTVGVLDDAEKPYSATTGADGTFQISSVPPYAYELVSVGGVDKITNRPAITMRAEGGAGGSAVTTNVLTPLTTLVAVTPPAQREAMKQTIAALGVDYKAKIDEGITPAAAALVKAVTTTASQVVAVLNSAAGGSEAVQKIPTTAVKAVQTELLTQLASNLAGKTAADLDSPAKVAAVTETATTTAVTRLVSGEAPAGGLTVAATAATIATQVATSVSDVVTAIQTTAGGTLGTDATSIKAEAVVVADAVAAIQESTSDAATTAAVTAADVVVPPPPNQAPTITGAASASGSVGVAFTYTPTVADADSSDILTLSITGSKAIPPGLTFNPTTGVISGTPTAAGTGTYTISVSDGVESASPPLTVTLTFTRVTGATGATF
ncbi:MAG: putative Ig domain [Pseudomonadota bacterium]|jgi:hypothetical protein